MQQKFLVCRGCALRPSMDTGAQDNIQSYINCNFPLHLYTPMVKFNLQNNRRKKTNHNNLPEPPAVSTGHFFSFLSHLKNFFPTPLACSNCLCAQGSPWSKARDMWTQHMTLCSWPGDWDGHQLINMQTVQKAWMCQTCIMTWSSWSSKDGELVIPRITLN